MDLAYGNELYVRIIWIFGYLTNLAFANTGQLDGTLFTFQDRACEDDNFKIRCPYGTTISIQWAQFGRLQPSHEVCPFSWPSEWHGDPALAKHGLPHVDSILHGHKEDTACVATTSLEIVLDQCQDRRVCKILASTGVFGQDPCQGTSKYLEVSYKCKPNEFRSRDVCEGQEMELDCGRSMRLAIYSSMFGRMRGGGGADGCRVVANANDETECQSHCSYDRVLRLCQGRRRCNIQATESMFGHVQGCPTPKYLRVVYTCVPKRILKDIREDEFYSEDCDLEDMEGGDVLDSPGPDVPNGGDGGNHGDGSQRLPEEEDRGGDADGLPVYARDHSTMHLPPQATPPSPQDNGGHVEWERLTTSPPEYNAPPGGHTDEPDTRASLDGHSSGFISDWLFTWDYIKDNQERFILYVSLAVCVGIICLLLAVVIRLAVLRRKDRTEAKLNISEPLVNSSPPPPPETSALLEPDDRDNGIEMLSYHHSGSLSRPPQTPGSHTGSLNRPPPGTFTGSLNRNNGWTNEYRNDVANRSLQNYYG